MEITQTTTTSSAVLPTATTSTSTQISSDFDVFLKMLTAQMQFQDPLNPIDSTDYATQLATFSQVEQAVLTNDLLTSLTTQMNVGGLTDKASWVGKEARSTAPVYFDGQPLELFPQASDLADQTEIIVRDAAGFEVQRISFAQGTEKITWAGVADGGTPMDAGLYSFQVVGTTDGVVITQAGVDAYSRISEVRLEQSGETLLVLTGGATVASNEVTALRDGSG